MDSDFERSEFEPPTVQDILDHKQGFFQFDFQTTIWQLTIWLPVTYLLDGYCSSQWFRNLDLHSIRQG